MIQGLVHQQKVSFNNNLDYFEFLVFIIISYFSSLLFSSLCLLMNTLVMDNMFHDVEITTYMRKSAITLTKMLKLGRTH